ncbi:MAG: cell division protein FtsL [Xanthomonadales bacterium]|nr:cell division protein FtsL [Gammaproteobacteria bacterium]MBT8050507.1 cell division protein FtsL [Gammaproteobacteria bacterium]MBT8056336.1 cell division protein FtsL [Gammaproteobacteria bacterium]NNJ78534.1 cell division protein FtsL [Xanthomonadales bacterium]NNL04429.1 cell division protein FtsL [Xanthomonadales bacterium]
MNKQLISILLALAFAIFSALGVVYTRHESRQHAVALGQLETQRDAFITEWSRLQLEQAVLADAGTVEPKARDALGMKSPDKTVILVVNP